ncbi:MAG: glycosyltransferase [Verrucomicrobiota bacterium]|nr:glycosyltransferase [Verrucomicrobiota bacterium]
MHEKIAYIEEFQPQDEHLFIVPGAKNEVVSSGRSRTYIIASPLISRRTQYRALLNLRALGEIIERERPDVIESGDPYQVGWKALRVGQAQGIPVVAFYHSHFAEAYLRGPIQHSLGKAAAEWFMQQARAYVRNFYNRFALTLVPSAGLAAELARWGVRNTYQVALGVNCNVFRPGEDRVATRAKLGVSEDSVLLLYVGRLAPEKNTQTLFHAFPSLVRQNAKKFHLLVIGDGQQSDRLKRLAAETNSVTWIHYCADSEELARYYRAADLFVHPGVEETFGLVALESQACATPVVGIHGTYMDEVIMHDQSAWAAANTPASLAEAIEGMAAFDLRALGQIAAANVEEKFAWPRVLAGLFSVYREVIASYRRAC